MPLRIDKGSVSDFRMDGNGTLIVNGILTRTGVFEYVHTDAQGKAYKTRELRHPTHVFDSEALASLAQLPVTDEHPAGAVTPENVKRLAVGNLGDSVRVDGDEARGGNVLAVLNIRDAAAIKSVQGAEGPAKRELSVGYTCDAVAQEGEWNGERYDHIQTNIRGNHVALVRKGRAGNARLMMDSADAVQADPDYNFALDSLQRMDADGARCIGKTDAGREVYASHAGQDYTQWTVNDHRDAKWMASREHSRLRDLLAFAQESKLGADLEGKITGMIGQVKATHDYHKAQSLTLDSSDSEQPQPRSSTVKHTFEPVVIGQGESAFRLDALTIEHADADTKAAESVKALKGQRDTAVDALRKSRADAERLAGENDALKAKAEIPAERLDALASERSDLFDVAEGYGFKRDDLRGKANADVVRAVAGKYRPELTLDGKSADYVQGIFDQARADLTKRADNLHRHLALGTALAPDTRADGAGNDSRSYGEIAAAESRKQIEAVRKDSYGW